VSETNQSEDPAAVQTDSESQEFGAEHGQDIAGQETGSSSPDAEASEQAEARGEKTDENRTANRSTPAD
jgi:hypothetical protein